MDSRKIKKDRKVDTFEHKLASPKHWKHEKNKQSRKNKTLQSQNGKYLYSVQLKHKVENIGKSITFSNILKSKKWEKYNKWKSLKIKNEDVA